MKAYCGRRLTPPHKTASDVEVITRDHLGHRILSPLPSQKLRNHSPDGFSWGYNGSGPAQLALAILFDATLNEDLALANYQDFKSQFVATWGDNWCVLMSEIDEFLRQARLDEDANESGGHAY
ncbi:hypothetical protein CMI37_17960 [Candidatus Pacearchaeota archaeon]|nr:hypothetical protein [Candidatus Pacearchaeota archaeon]|tara:strand:+ start:918 stop:1286 length:369 start_codon:yes stop_codon:yes gene_type:complete